MGKENTGKNRQKVAKWIIEMLPKKCCNCGSGKNIQYHHIVPATCGGNDVPSNIAVLCCDCHSKVHYGKGGVINHGDCVKRGMAEAKKRGTHFGKKSADYDGIMSLIAKHSTKFNSRYELDFLYTESEIAEMAGVKMSLYHKCQRMLIEAMQKEEWPYEFEKPKQILPHALYDHYIRKLRGDAV